MAVGTGKLPVLHAVKGLRLGVAAAGLKQLGRNDVVVVELAEGSHCAAIFTKNAFCAAPVQLAKQHIAKAQSRYCLINTGNANAGTGSQGLADALACCETLAAAAQVSVEQVLPFSTGVIGEPLPVAKIQQAVPRALAQLSENQWAEAAAGIMTTDTRPKAASRQLQLHGETITITGMAKGAGMIKPNMATMLAYVATDASIETALLNELLHQAVDCSFNRITVDSDTSTNDACVLMATGQSSAVSLTKQQTAAYSDFSAALNAVFIELAHGLVKDAEGATKFVAVQIEQAANQQEALAVAYTIAESPLVKTALFASDPNWGRLLAAIGRAGIKQFDVNKVNLYLNDCLIASGGCRAPGYTEEQGVAAMAVEDITIRVELQRGEHSETVWTCDLSYDYVRINADYRT